MTIKNIFEIHHLYIFSALISSLTGHFKEFIIITIIILIHELGHVLTALFLKWKIEKIVLLPFGGLTVFNEDINKPLKEEFFILINGPIFQLIFTFVFKDNGVLLNYSTIILLFNLLPIHPLDGSKLINIFLNIFISFKKSFLFTMYLSFVTIAIILYKFDFNLILMLIMFFITIRVIGEYKRRNNIFNRFLLERYTKTFLFKKTKIIKSLKFDKMKRDYKHIFYDGNRYITERENLKKRFDFNSKTW